MMTILSVLAGAADVLQAGWRFCIALVAGCAAAAATYFGLGRPGESVVPAVLLILAAVAVGLAWELAAGKRRRRREQPSR